MRSMLHALFLLPLVLISLPFALMPYHLSLKVGEGMGSLLFYLWRSRRTIAVENLRGAVLRGAVIIDSTPEALIQQNFRNMGKSFVEIVKIYYGLGRRILERVEIRGEEHFKNAQKKGLGVLLITGHCGNWELNPAALAMYVTRVNPVAREQNNPFLNRIIERTRERFGNRTIYKQGALKRILLALKRNETVGILMDQSVVRSEGVVGEFLGKKDYIMKTPALIARKTGSPVVPVFIRRVHGGHVIEIGSEIGLDTSSDTEEAVRNDTLKFSGYIEDYIRKNPAEWLWIHRRWKRTHKIIG